MARYIVRRILGMAVTLLGVSIVVFLILYMIPGDPAREIAGPRASIATVIALRHELGLDRPVPIQYLRFLTRALTGDLGTSWRFSRRVLSMILEKFPATAQLALACLFVELLLGLSFGAISAFREYGVIDRLVMVVSFIFLSIPSFWLALLMLFIFGFKLPWFPLGGYGQVKHIVLPALTVGLLYSPWYARMFRSSLVDVFKSDYLITARAKGLPPRLVFLRHALPNAIRPIITMVGIDLAGFLGGIVVIEVVFGWPGIGLQAWDSINNLDIPVVMGSVMFSATLVCLLNLLVDLTYTIVDPRVVYR